MNSDMNSNMNSEKTQCYMVQLQIDSFLDNELESTQLQAFTGHLQACPACARELRFAQALHDRLLDLPQPDCAERVLRPVYQLCEQTAPAVPGVPGVKHSKDNGTTNGIGNAPFWSGLMAWLQAAPAGLRLAAPLALSAAVVVMVAVPLLRPAFEPAAPSAIPTPPPRSVATVPGLNPVPNSARPMPVAWPLADNGAVYNDYTDEEIRQALRDLNTAINTLNQVVSERTDTLSGSRYLLPPLQGTFDASLRRISDDSGNGPGNRRRRPLQENGPI